MNAPRPVLTLAELAQASGHAPEAVEMAADAGVILPLPGCPSTFDPAALDLLRLLVPLDSAGMPLAVAAAIADAIRAEPSPGPREGAKRVAPCIADAIAAARTGQPAWLAARLFHRPGPRLAARVTGILDAAELAELAADLSCASALLIIDIRAAFAAPNF